MDLRTQNQAWDYVASATRAPIVVGRPGAWTALDACKTSLSAISVSGGAGLAVGGGGAFCRLIDGSWTDVLPDPYEAPRPNPLNLVLVTQRTFSAVCVHPSITVVGVDYGYGVGGVHAVHGWFLENLTYGAQWVQYGIRSLCVHGGRIYVACAGWIRSAAVGSKGGGAWTFEQPEIPVDIHSIRSVGDTVYAVGDWGRIFRKVGGTWAEMASPTQRILRDVWGSAPNDVWAVGDRGVLVHWDGEAWALQQPFGSTIDLLGVCGHASDDVLAVGRAGTMFHWDGAAWASLPRVISVPLTSVCTQGDGYAVAGKIATYPIVSGEELLSGRVSSWSPLPENYPGPPTVAVDFPPVPDGIVYPLETEDYHEPLDFRDVHPRQMSAMVWNENQPNSRVQYVYGWPWGGSGEGMYYQWSRRLRTGAQLTINWDEEGNPTAAAYIQHSFLFFGSAGWFYLCYATLSVYGGRTDQRISRYIAPWPGLGPPVWQQSNLPYDWYVGPIEN